MDLGRHALREGVATPPATRSSCAIPTRWPATTAPPSCSAPSPTRELKSGVVILYDAEVEDFDADGDPETGAGLGLRFADADGRNGVDLLACGYRRKLADTVALNGTFYGGDLDLLRGPENSVSLPADRRRQAGGGRQPLALPGAARSSASTSTRTSAGCSGPAIEAEAAWRFDLPLRWATGGRQLFPSIAPAVRYSQLDPDFAAPAVTPSPSFAWQWTKIDSGVRVGIVVRRST